MIKSNDFIASFQAGVLQANSQYLFGADLSFGQKINQIGFFGINFGTYLNSRTIEPVISVGLDISLSLNDLFTYHLSWGEILIPFKLGFTSSSNISQHIHGGLGLKLKLGKTLFVYTESRFYYNIDRTDDKARWIYDNLDFWSNLPYALIIGIGTDIG